MTVDPLGTGGERSVRRPERGLTAQQIERGGAQQAQDGPGGVGVQDMAVLAEGVVLDVEEPVLDAPVAAAQGQHPLRTGAVGVQAGDQLANAGADLTRGQPHPLGAHLGRLRQARKQAVAGQRRGDPNLPPLQAAMPLAHLDSVGRAGRGGEEEGDLGVDGGLVFLSRSR